MSFLTYTQALNKAQAVGLERLDAQLLLLHALEKPASDRAWLVAHDADKLPEAVLKTYEDLCLRRAQGEPLAYLVGKQEFFGLALQVDARVLIPRTDTEILVQWAIDLAQSAGEPSKLKALDLGTGSGAIALALKHACPALHVSAIDASVGAVAVAKANAQALGLDIKVELSDWYAKVSGHFDLILSNPPYIALDDHHLPGLKYEPTAALTAGPDGLNDLRRIIRQAPEFLNPQGWLLLEHGYDQAEAVCKLLNEAGFCEVQSRQDLAGILRCSGGQWPGKPIQI